MMDSGQEGLRAGLVEESLLRIYMLVLQLFLLTAHMIHLRDSAISEIISGRTTKFGDNIPDYYTLI